MIILGAEMKIGEEDGCLGACDDENDKDEEEDDGDAKRPRK